MLAGRHEPVEAEVGLLGLHLTSERAKERTEALGKLQDLLKDKKWVRMLTTAQCNRIVHSFFSMLAIEVKYGDKGDCILPSALSKLRQLLRDSAALLSTITCRPIILECIDDVLDSLVSLRLEELLPDTYRAINVLLSDRKHLLACSRDHVRILYDTCTFMKSSSGRGELSKTMTYVGEYAYEMNDLYTLKNLVQICLEHLLGEEQGIPDAVASHLLRTFETCLRGLKDAYPVFSRSIVRRLLDGLSSKGFVKRARLVEEIVLVCETASSCIVIDPAACDRVSKLLLEEAVFSRYRLESCNPAELVSQSCKNTAVMPFLSCLSKYCKLPKVPIFESKSSLSKTTAIFLSKCLFHRDSEFDSGLWQNRPSQCSPVDASWMMLALSLTNYPSPPTDQVLEYVVSSLSRPLQSESAANLLKSAISRFSIHLSTMSSAITNAELTPLLVELMALNYITRYRDILWSDSAKLCFRDAINSLAFMISNLESRQVPGKLLAIMPKISTFFAVVFGKEFHNGGYAQMCQSLLDCLDEVIKSIEPDAFSNILRLKWSCSAVTSEQSVALFTVSLRILRSALTMACDAEIGHLFDIIDTMQCKPHAAQYLSEIASPIIVDSMSFDKTGYDRIIAMCIGVLLSNRQASMVEEEFQSLMDDFDTKAAYMCLETLTTIYEKLMNVNVKTDEIEQVILDCGIFILDQLVEHELSIQDVAKIFERLSKNLSDDLLERGADLIGHFFGLVDSATITKFCLELLQRQPSSIGTRMREKMSTIIESYDLESVPSITRENLYQMQQVLSLDIEPIDPALSHGVVEKIMLPETVYYMSRRLYHDVISAKVIQICKRDDLPGTAVLATINEILLNVTNPLDRLVEAKQYLNMILPSEDHVLKARCFLLGKSSGVAGFFTRGVVELEESFWFWQCCSKSCLQMPIAFEFVDAAFCPVIARAMLGHFDGHREISSKAIKFFKSALPPLDFEQRFKSSLFKILAFVVLYYHELSTPDDGMLEVKNVFDSIYGSILLMEMMNTCNNDVALLSVHLRSTLFLVSKCSNVHPRITDYLLAHIEQSASRGAGDTLRKALESRRTETGLDSVLRTSDVQLGICHEIMLKFHVVPLKLCPEVLKIVSEAVNSVASDRVPEELLFARIPNGSRFIPKASLVDKAICEDDADAQFIAQRLLDTGALSLFEPMFKSASVVRACGRWICAALLASSPAKRDDFTSRCPPSFIACLAEGLKILQVSLATPEIGRIAHFTTDHVVNLFLAETMNSTDKQLFHSIFNSLPDTDYQNYSKILGESMDLEQEDQILDRQLVKYAKESLLLNQCWDITDVPPSYDHCNEDNRLYLVLRSMVADQSVLDKSQFPADPALSLVVASAKALVNPEKRGTITNLAFQKFMESKNDPRKLYKVQRAIQVSADRLDLVDLQVMAKIAKATFLWKANVKERALQVIYDAACSDHESALDEIRTALLLKVSKYAWKMKSKTANQIRREYLDRIDVSKHTLLQRSKAFNATARFYDEQYQNQEALGLLAARKKLLVDSRKDLSEQTTLRDAKLYEKSKLELKRQIRQDELDLERMLNDRASYGLKAAANYLKAITHGDKYDMTVFRICSLWFSFKNAPQINEMLNRQVPTHKFIPLMYQLVARAEQTEDDDLFQTTLQNLLQDILCNHPYHSLHQLLAMRSSGSTAIGSKRRLVCSDNIQDRRAQAAGQIVAKGKCLAIKDLICDTEKLWAAYTEMASSELPPDTSTKVVHAFEARWCIRKMNDLCCPVLTLSIPVDVSGRYAGLTTVVGFAPEGYRVIGGVNLPKIVQCRGSDGRLYRQLVKGRDDVRQIFRLVNRVLSTNPLTAQLSLRTYRVIPLQPLAGVIEWIENAVPIGDYLNSAHPRFRPQDIAPKEARGIMKREFERPDSNPSSKHCVFMEEIQARFKPVFRHFFLESTYSIHQWYCKRLHYIKSTAVGSMIGYIVGLGDRHCQNIMMDQDSGELIHIDLNMIFEFGKTLRIPERVPFRLTRDLVDGMGFAGVEAGFTGKATSVMIAVRNKMDIMLMVMEAFKYDPLYRWANLNAAVKETFAPDTPIDDSGTVNKEADRALLRVREKLLGLEEGTLLSERGQVSYLVLSATNEELLAQMYHGWQPWM
ncbi:Serine-protein kinase ATM [Paramicrosporidium saccamoebae]|uniref:Serine/threonine-protein kinase TEL1 n=1 Tax=Paramicrosporidium saccamoebae TaxID=1246581 RepID=A0A2H9TKZ8_9FUNG|nr:Serine-protein kinase ATM [Paramicrosporidium saccamoebae]